MKNLRMITIFIFLLDLSISQNCCEQQNDALLNCDSLGCYIPQCDESCGWLPLQCWDSTGYCWCVDSNGIEIEDSSTAPGYNLPDCSDYTCDTGFQSINGRCYYENDILFLQNMIDNSYESQIDLDCESDAYCGSPNPYMDDPDSWFSMVYDEENITSKANGNGIVEPLELGLQEWQNGRLKSLMCGAYIYCQLSGPIPTSINSLEYLEVLRLEGNYLSGFIPENLCELDLMFNDYLAFDLDYNLLCPPFPDCIYMNDNWSQNLSDCNEVGDINLDTFINILDITILVSIIIENQPLDYQALTQSDINFDDSVDVLDILGVVEVILN